MMGEPNEHPVYPASAIADHMTAVNAFGTPLFTQALFHRARTGQGQHIDLALVDCTYNSHDWQLAAFSTSGGELDPQRGGTQRTGAFPYGVFKSKDGYIGIGIFTEPQWEALVRRIGHSELLEIEEFKTPGGRFANQAALKQIIEDWFATLPNDDEAVRIMADELRLPAARVLSVGQFARDPILSRRMVAKVPTADGSEMLLLKSPHKFSKTPPSDPPPAAALGENTSEVLRSVCNYPPDKIEALLREGVVTETHPG